MIIINKLNTNMPKLNNQVMTEIIQSGIITEHFNAFAYKYWEAREQSGQTHRDPVRYEIPNVNVGGETFVFDFSGIQLNEALQGIVAVSGNTLFISWRGTVHEEHIRADLERAPADASFAECKDTFLNTLDSTIGHHHHQDKLEIMFFGHSLGGAIAQLSIDAVTTAILDDSKYLNISFDKIKTLTLSTANSPGVSQEVRGRFTENSSKCKEHGLTLNALLLRTQGDIIQHHCPQLASVGSWGKRELIIRPGLFENQGSTTAGLAVSIVQQGLSGFFDHDNHTVDRFVNGSSNLANKIAVHKEQYLIDQLATTPDTIIYTPNNAELVELGLEGAGDYYNPEKLCGLILVTDSDHFNDHVAYDATVSAITSEHLDPCRRLLSKMIPQPAEPIVEARPPQEPDNIFYGLAKGIVSFAHGAVTLCNRADSETRRQMYFTSKVGYRVGKHKKINAEHKQTVNKLAKSIAFRTLSENCKKSEQWAITKLLNRLINYYFSALKYTGLIRYTELNAHERLRAKQFHCASSSSIKILSEPLHTTWERVSSPPQASQSLS